MPKRVTWFESLAWCFQGKGVVRSPSGREFCYSPTGDFWTRNTKDGPWTNMYHTKAMLAFEDLDDDWLLAGESYPKE